MRGITFCIARVHSLSAYFIDYIRMDPQINVDGMLDNRKRSLAGYRMAGKYLAVIQPFSALLANACFRSEHSMHAYMEPSLALLREWESCLGMEDIALVIRAGIALLESIKAYVSVHIFSVSDRHHDLADLADEWTQSIAPRVSRPAPANPPGLARAIVHRSAPYCFKFQSKMCSAKACNLAHVCVVPDCSDDSAQGSTPGISPRRTHCARRSFARKEHFLADVHSSLVRHCIARTCLILLSFESPAGPRSGATTSTHAVKCAPLATLCTCCIAIVRHSVSLCLTTRKTLCTFWPFFAAICQPPRVSLRRLSLPRAHRLTMTS